MLGKAEQIDETPIKNLANKWVIKDLLMQGAKYFRVVRLAAKILSPSIDKVSLERLNS